MQSSLIIRVIYFFSYFAFSSWLSFYSIQMEEAGFSGWQIGIIMAIMPAMTIFVLPVWGVITDKQGRKITLMIALLLSSMIVITFYFHNLFPAYLITIFILSVFYTPIGSMVDTLALDQQYSFGKSAYGTYRLWGSIGWGVGSMLIGLYLTNNSTDHIFIIASSLLFITFLLSWFGLKKSKKVQVEKFKLSFLMQLIKQKEIALFLIITILYGIFTSPIYLLINLYFKEVGFSKSLIGLGFTVQTISELPFFFFGLPLVRFLGGPRKTMVVTMIVSFLRLFIYSQTENHFVVLGICLLQGITLSLFVIAAIEYLHRNIPENYRATGQSLIWASYFGLGNTLGYIWLGLLLDEFGMKKIMLFNGISLLILIFLTILVFAFLVRKRIQVNLKQNGFLR